MELEFKKGKRFQMVLDTLRIYQHYLVEKARGFGLNFSLVFLQISIVVRYIFHALKKVPSKPSHVGTQSLQI